MRRSWVVTLLLSVIAVTGLTSAIFGQPRVVQTGCDTLSLAPPLVRVQFRVVAGEHQICHLHMFPLSPTPPDTCSPPILECGGPSELGCSASYGSALWTAHPDPGGQPYCIPSGVALDSFAIVVADLQSCCYRVAFYWSEAVPEPDFIDTVCFTRNQPVWARPNSWGKLKLRYR
jgi:hypothetical protein